MDKVLLVIIAASGLCAVYAHVGGQFHFVYEPKNMTEALSYCREKYTDLASIKSLDDVELLNSMADTSQMIYDKYKYRAWIGLYDDVNSWRWSLSDESFYKPGENEFRNWYPGEPDNYGSGEDCVVLRDDTGEWSDSSCEQQLQPICCDVTGSSVEFVLIPTSMTWTEAQSYCREHHTDLASVRNMAENQEINDMVTAGQRVWIGLSRESWKWTDGSSSSFRYWDEGQPKNKNNVKICVAAHFGENGKWEDWSCKWERAFICYGGGWMLSSETPDMAAEEKEHEQKVFKQVIKVKMETQKSSMNLNDPAVMEDLLKQLEQKLKDQGVNENVKLSWRKQADGKVFHKEEKKKTKEITDD